MKKNFIIYAIVFSVFALGHYLWRPAAATGQDKPGNELEAHQPENSDHGEHGHYDSAHAKCEARESEDTDHGKHDDDKHVDKDDDKHDGYDDDGATAAKDSHAGHAHAEVSAENLFTVECEHDIPQYTCDECRYEIGMVKVADELIRRHDTSTGLVEIVEAKRQKAEVMLDVTGEIQLNANREVHISPRISGVVREVRVDIGGAVKKDDVLFEIESTELGRAIGDYKKGLAMTALSKTNLDREEKLFARKVGSEVDVIEARMQYEQYRADLEAAEHQLHVMGLDEDDVKAIHPDRHAGMTGRLPYRAPMDGRIVERHLALGEMAEPGKDVMLLADLSSVWVWLDIYEQDLGAVLARFKAGEAAVVVTSRAFPGSDFAGRIDLIGSVMDEKTRTVKVRAVLDNPDEMLKPGMFCHARIALSDGEETLAVPKEALLTDEGQSFVFRHAREQYYVRQPVKAGRRFTNSIEILNGLAAGDRIVGRGAFLLKSDILKEKMGAGCAD